MKKRAKILSVLLALSMMLSILPVGALAAEQTTQAMPTNDSLTVNGALQTPTVYKINGYNYFKIRDVAAVLNGTSKQFDVGYDKTTNSVTATTGKGYTKQSTDLAGAPAGGDKAAALSNDVIYVNGARVEAEVYKIDGNNYFKLRDLGGALGFEVGYEAGKGVFIDTEPAPTLSDEPLYEDSNVKISFLRVEERQGDVRLYLDVDNKTGQKLTVQCDAVSLNGYCFNSITMSDDVAANSIGTVDASIRNFDYDLVDLNSVETVGGQFRIIPGGVFSSSGDSYDAIFPATNIYTGETDNTIPSAGGRELLYSDSKVEFYFDRAEADSRSSDEIRVYLMVRNKTDKTLLIQNDTVTVNRRSYERTTMSDPVLAHSAGYVDVSVREYNGPSAETITTIGGDFRVIDDTGRDRTYTATMGTTNPGTTDPGATDPGTTKPTDPGTTDSAITKLVRYISTYGKLNTSGNRMLKNTYDGDTMAIVYDRSANQLSFIYQCVFDDGSESVVGFEYDIATQRAVTPVTITFSDNRGTLLFGAKANFDISAFTTSTKLNYAESDFVSFVPGDSLANARDLLDSTVQLAVAGWELQLIAITGISLSDIGFTSLSY